MSDRKLNIVKNIAKNKGIKNWDTINISNVKNKRFSIITPNNKKIHFGLYPYKNGTYIDHKNKILRKNWRARHIKILKDNKPAYLNKESPEYYSWNLLW